MDHPERNVRLTDLLARSRTSRRANSVRSGHFKALTSCNKKEILLTYRCAKILVVRSRQLFSNANNDVNKYSRLLSQCNYICVVFISINKHVTLCYIVILLRWHGGCPQGSEPILVRSRRMGRERHDRPYPPPPQWGQSFTHFFSS